MACWSAENATNAYLSTLKMGQRAKEPDVAEFISALAAGNNAQQMVVACAGPADPTILLALIAAAQQTRGQVICIVQNPEQSSASEAVLGRRVEFVAGEAQELLVTSRRFEAADFVLVDCNLERHEEVLGAVRVNNGTVVVGYNALSCKRCWWNCGTKTQFLPIGEGLLVTRFGGFGGSNSNSPKYGGGMGKSKSRWVVKVDKCTGEEHVFRVRMPQGRVIHA